MHPALTPPELTRTLLPMGCNTASRSDAALILFDRDLAPSDPKPPESHRPLDALFSLCPSPLSSRIELTTLEPDPLKTTWMHAAACPIELEVDHRTACPKPLGSRSVEAPSEEEALLRCRDPFILLFKARERIERSPPERCT